MLPTTNKSITLYISPNNSNSYHEQKLRLETIIHIIRMEEKTHKEQRVHDELMSYNKH
jgi:hypothetical protein